MVPEDSAWQAMLHVCEIGCTLNVSKSQQGGLQDAEDESDGNIFADKSSGRCPIKALENYPSHLNPAIYALFQSHLLITFSTQKQQHLV